LWGGGGGGGGGGRERMRLKLCQEIPGIQMTSATKRRNDAGALVSAVNSQYIESLWILKAIDVSEL